MKRFFAVIAAIFCMVGASFAEENTLPDLFEVKGVAAVIYQFEGGKIVDQGKGDGVIYSVNRKNKKIVRKAILNSEIKEGPGAGFQPDSTEYEIVYDADDPETGKHLIKGFGNIGSGHGFETVVIDEKNITSSNLKSDYFVLYFFERTDLTASEHSPAVTAELSSEDQRSDLEPTVNDSEQTAIEDAITTIKSAQNEKEQVP